LKGHHFSPSKFLKTLFFPKVHPLEFQWLLLEEVVLEAKEWVEKFKEKIHPLEFFPR
jgi:hypothetical protein